MPKIEVICQECKKSKFVFPSLAKNRKYGNFCSLDCLGAFRTRKLTGSLSANYKTGDVRDRDYVMVHAPWHPNATNKNKVYLHRLIVEARLGRLLNEDEVVHHKDGNKENNYWENLEVMTQSEHARKHKMEKK